MMACKVHARVYKNHCCVLLKSALTEWLSGLPSINEHRVHQVGC